MLEAHGSTIVVEPITSQFIYEPVIFSFVQKTVKARKSANGPIAIIVVESLDIAIAQKEHFEEFNKSGTDQVVVGIGNEYGMAFNQVRFSTITFIFK